MNTNLSMAWLREAVGGIKYPPDRRRVEKELYSHIMNRNRDYLKAGCTEREADEKVCTAMGDPVEIRRELAAIHRPFWGYAFLALRVLVIGILLWALIVCIRNSWRLSAAVRPLVDQERYTVARWIPQSGKVRCGDYVFRLKRAAYARDRETGEPCLLLELGTGTSDIRLGAPYLPWDNELTESRGQTYPVSLAAQRELVFTCSILYRADGMEEGAEWAVLTIPGPEGPVWLTVQLGEGGR